MTKEQDKAWRWLNDTWGVDTWIERDGNVEGNLEDGDGFVIYEDAATTVEGRFVYP